MNKLQYLCFFVLLLCSCGGNTSPRCEVTGDNNEDCSIVNADGSKHSDEKYTFESIWNVDGDFAGVILHDCEWNYIMFDEGMDWNKSFWTIFLAAYVGEKMSNDDILSTRQLDDRFSFYFCGENSEPPTGEEEEYLNMCFEEAVYYLQPSDNQLLVGSPISRYGVRKYPIGKRYTDFFFKEHQDSLVIERVSQEMKDRKKVVDYDIKDYYINMEDVPIGSVLVYIERIKT